MRYTYLVLLQWDVHLSIRHSEKVSIWTELCLPFLSPPDPLVYWTHHQTYMCFPFPSAHNILLWANKSIETQHKTGAGPACLLQCLTFSAGESEPPPKQRKLREEYFLISFPLDPLSPCLLLPLLRDCLPLCLPSASYTSWFVNQWKLSNNIFNGREIHPSSSNSETPLTQHTFEEIKQT